MSPGIWNNYYFSSEEIKGSFQNTDWKSKEVRSLFLDHVDDRSREWIGEIQNPRLIGDVVKADLVIVDKDTAIKLAYGAKMGISPKVTGESEDDENVMHQFLYNNFSVVINPAVKTAWINNAEMTAFEKIRKEKGMSPDEFYAIPMNPPSASKLPIHDSAHVRNALARINQVKGVSEEDLAKAMTKIKAAAKKFNIEIDDKMEEKNMDSNEEINSVEMEEVDQDLMDYADFVKQARKEHPDWSFEEIAAEYKKTQTNAEAEAKVNKLLGLAEQFITLAEELKIIKNETTKEKPEEETDEEKPEEENADKPKEEEDPEADKEAEDAPKETPEEKPKEIPKEVPKAEDSKEKPKDEEEDEKDKKMSETISQIDALKKQNEELMQKIEQINKTNTQTMSQFNELKKKLDEPDKLSVKTVSMSNKKPDTRIIEESEDMGFLNALKDDLGGI